MDASSRDQAFKVLFKRDKGIDLVLKGNFIQKIDIKIPNRLDNEEAGLVFL